MTAVIRSNKLSVSEEVKNDVALVCESEPRCWMNTYLLTKKSTFTSWWLADIFSARCQCKYRCPSHLSNPSMHPFIHPPLFPRRPEGGWPSPEQCTGGSGVLHTNPPCKRPGRRCRGLAERGNPPRRPGGRRKTNRGWKRMGWSWELTTATPSSVPMQPTHYENNEN